MKNILRTTYVLAFSALFLIGCNFFSSPLKGHFSQQVADNDEPQTDDERTLIGEFNEYVSLADSLAAIWDGTDTLNMRRLFFEIGEQRSRVNKAGKFQNVRHALNAKIDSQVKSISDDIDLKFPKEIREEWFNFYFEIYHCRSIWKNDHNRPGRNEKVYQNTLGEYYVIRKDRNGVSKKVPVYFEDGKYYQDVVEGVKLEKLKNISNEY